jgi:hypothetical protein
MASAKQERGSFGEKLVVTYCSCPRCKREKTLKRLPTNFKCADIICDFCGYMAQVKTHSTNNVEEIPARIPGASWKAQKDRIDAGIFIPLFLVLVSEAAQSIFYLSTDAQNREIFSPRKPLAVTAKRAGWQGFFYDFSRIGNTAFHRMR